MTAPPSPSTPPGARRPREARVADVSAGARPCRSETGSHGAIVLPGCEARPPRRWSGYPRHAHGRRIIAQPVAKTAACYEGVGLTRDNLVLVMYAEDLDSAKNSATLQRADRQGILVRQVALKRK